MSDRLYTAELYAVKRHIESEINRQKKYLINIDAEIEKLETARDLNQNQEEKE